ncbi:hypothetical protein DF185_19840 [Marinifilum breve]|uniref:Uncharacterized protein n=1 Tax=Marinifilum breve TaxID=2184082 RepID=A0A2V3ZSS8_9BACT|nr:hypothetical protein DF185_19840 [Marinifilum breve]
MKIKHIHFRVLYIVIVNRLIFNNLQRSLHFNTKKLQLLGVLLFSGKMPFWIIVKKIESF